MKHPGLLVKFRPSGPWRFGPDNGARDRANVTGHSDTVYSAVCSAMAHLGELERWLEATARAAEPAVRFSSLFPFQARTLFAPPPQHLWPPALAQRLRFRSAQFAPLALIQDLVREQPLREDRWEVDGLSGCVIYAGGQSPFRETLRTGAAIDRQSGAALPHQTACIEFNQNCGLWLVAEFAGAEAAETWLEPVKAAFRWLGDSGFGGERSRGWGRSEEVEFQRGQLPDLLIPPGGEETEITGHWLLSLYSPAANDGVDWDRGDYKLHVRNGRVDAGGALKRSLRMVSEGSVILAHSRPQGMAHDVAPAEHAHPVYRAGWALSIALPWRAAEDRPLAPLAEIRPAATEPLPGATPEAEAPAVEVVPVDEAPAAEPLPGAAPEADAPAVEVVPVDEAPAADGVDTRENYVEGEGI